MQEILPPTRPPIGIAEMKLRIYLDTSVFSARFDDRAPERMALTAEFFSRAERFELSTSALARDEIDATPDAARRGAVSALLKMASVLEIVPDMRSLARRYVEDGVFSGRQSSDALHVAAAVVSRHDILLSWNFKHLVNRRRRALVLALNAREGYPALEIIPPPEV